MARLTPPVDSFDVGSVTFTVVPDALAGPRLAAADPRFQVLVITFDWAAEGLLGDPCTVAARIRAGGRLTQELGAIVPAGPQEPDLDRAWRIGDEPLCRVSVWFAGHPPSLLASREWVADVFERYMQIRLGRLPRWIFRSQPTWCEPAPGEQAAVQAVERLAAAVVDSEPAREPGAAYDAWLSRSDRLLTELTELGLAGSHAVLPYKKQFLDRWQCSELARWYAAAAGLDAWRIDRLSAGPVPRPGDPPDVSPWLFRFQDRPPAPCSLPPSVRSARSTPTPAAATSRLTTMPSSGGASWAVRSWCRSEPDWAGVGAGGAGVVAARAVVAPLS